MFNDMLTSENINERYQTYIEDHPEDKKSSNLSVKV